MSTPVRIYDTAEQLGRSLAEQIADGIAATRSDGRRFLLGCPGGRTARTTYAALADVVTERQLPLDNLVIAMMDDYVDPAGAPPRRAPSDVHYSCQRFGRTEIVLPLNAASPKPIPDAQLWLPDPAQPEMYDEQLIAAGDIDLFLLASGESDGHVAFNPPGSPVDGATRVLTLAEETRRDNMNTFPQFEHLTDVPTHGVTVGIGTIAQRARELVMILVGEHKQTAFRRITAVEDYDSEWPATVVHLGKKASILADKAAAGS